MRIFGNQRTDKGKARRLRPRHLLPLGLLLLVPILLAPSGSAARPPVTKFEICVQNATTATPTPACGGATGSVFAGNTTATVTVSVENDSSSTTSIGSANVIVPNQLKVVAGSGLPTTNVTVSGQQVQIRGVKIQSGRSFAATFQVYVACGGEFSWPAQQAASDDNLAGTSFTYQAGSSTGVSTSITTACHLGFVQQPTDTKSGDTIVNRLSQLDQSVTVGLFDNDGDPLGACPVGYESGCSVDVGSTPGGVTGTTTQSLVGGDLAAFGDLSITNGALATQYNLTATGNGGFAPQVTSSSFLIAQTVTPLSCPGSSCTTGNGHQSLSGGVLGESFVDVTSSSGFNFMTVAPFTLSTRETPPAGCTGIKPFAVTGFAESDNRQPGSGTLTIRYYVNKDLLTATYGKNVGNQFIPMCVGARPVDMSTGTIHDCNDPNYASVGWLGDAISGSGRFTGGPARAICDSDGYYYGVISSYQDKLDATANPTVTNWGGTQINGDNYRFFDMSIPPGWDWRSGP